ncbi:MAG: DUF2177 family protein [Gammaproteobacteria bacterium]|nr:DUF2177 family protein [Woeseia sp.]MBT8103203.1 DUF2177 family protein [Gammaproteobacteria bacterium]
MTLIKAFIATIVTFLVIDAIWITLFVVDYYETQVGSLMRETPNFVAALVFYLAYAFAVVVLAVRPALASKRIVDALLLGALLGAIAYGTFTITNYAVLKDWTMGLVISDIAWGTFLTAIVAASGYLAARTRS